MAKNGYPKDVQDIIEYTRLRKEFPETDAMLRNAYRFHSTLNMRQMYMLLGYLKEHKRNVNPTEDILVQKHSFWSQSGPKLLKLNANSATNVTAALDVE